MVTNFGPQQQQQQQLIPLPHRRAASVTSRASTSRRSRQSRSHHGSAVPNLQNEFPYFAQTGDVEICLISINGRREQNYPLHNLILSQASGTFEADLAENVSNALITAPLRDVEPHQPHTRGSIATTASTSRDDARTSFDAARYAAPRDTKRRWRYVLDWGNTADHEVPLLVMRQPSHNNDTIAPPVSMTTKPPASSAAFFRSMANLSALTSHNRDAQARPDPGDEVLRDYDRLFRCFYNYAPELDAVNIATAYTECKALLHLADLYDALDIVGGRVDHHMLQFGNRLFRQIARYPSSYLKLGYLARSKTIFAEALIHVVGQWPLPRPYLEHQIDPAVLDLIEDKAEILDDMKTRVDTIPSWSDWLAMSLFRQWLAENLDSSTPDGGGAAARKPRTERRHSNARDASAPARRDSGHGSSSSSAARVLAPASTALSSSGGRAFRLLGSTNRDADLAQDEVKRFLKHSTPPALEGLYTRENARRMMRRLDELKDMARPLVRPLVKNMLELDLAALSSDGGGGNGGGGGSSVLGYLTCTRVGRGDFPWEH